MSASLRPFTQPSSDLDASAPCSAARHTLTPSHARHPAGRSSKLRQRVALVALTLAAGLAQAGGIERFVPSAVPNGDGSFTLPLHEGRSAAGETVWYVILDASDGKDAASLGINQAAKLANARGTAATQKVRLVGGLVNFPATVDFSPDHLVQPGATGFPPAQAAPGSVGEVGYSPLIEFADGRILNAPQVARGDARTVAGDAAHKHTHDKVVAIDLQRGTVTLAGTEGRSGGKVVQYISTDASVDVVAALEGATYAPALGAAPAAGGDGTDSARAGIAVFTNGQTGAANRQRQGLSSALLDGLSPLNVTAWSPNQGRYSPLWDVYPAVWTEAAIQAGRHTRQSDFGQVAQLGEKGLVTNLDGSPFGPFPGRQGAVVNCPIVSGE